MRIESVHFKTSGVATIAISGGFLFLIPLARIKEILPGASLISTEDYNTLDQAQIQEVFQEIPALEGEFHEEDDFFLTLSRIDEETRAKNKAIELCSLAEQSSSGLYKKLVAKGFSRHAIQKALETAKHEGFLDDARFARIWARRRVEKTLCGPKTLLAELASRGISSDDAKKAVAEIQFDHILPAAFAKTLRKLSKKYGVSEIVQRAYHQLRLEGFDSESLKNLIDSEKNSL